jgi:hypothetical protein
MSASLDFSSLRIPRPGDVIFTYSGTPDAVGSCLIQRTLFSKRGGPWFSHVSVAVSHKSVIEASSEPEENATTWSGVQLQPNGVRLQLLPDLIFSAAKFTALRHPKAADAEWNFQLHAPQVSALYGSGYSIEALKAAAESANSSLARFIPKALFDWKAEPDKIAMELRSKPEVREDIEKHLPTGTKFSVLNDYFCSQLVGLLLFGARLVDQDPGIITPCALYDQLSASGWDDVTESDYGKETQERWKRMSPDNWRTEYQIEMGLATSFRQHAFISGYLGAAEGKMNDFQSNLAAVAEKLAAMGQDEHIGKG